MSLFTSTADDSIDGEVVLPTIDCGQLTYVSPTFVALG